MLYAVISLVLTVAVL